MTFMAYIECSTLKHVWLGERMTDEMLYKSGKVIGILIYCSVFSSFYVVSAKLMFKFLNYGVKSQQNPLPDDPIWLLQDRAEYTNLSSHLL